MYGNQGQPVLKVAAGDDQVVITGKCILHRIIVGKDVTNGEIEVSDHATVGDADVKFHLVSSTMKGTYEIGATFEKGITADLTNQTHVTFVVSPSN